MSTLTRGATTIAPLDVIGWQMESPVPTVVHAILGAASPDLTILGPAGTRTGTVTLLFGSEATAEAAAASLRATLAGPWSLVVTGRPALTMTMHVVSAVTIAATGDHGGLWLLTFVAQETTP